MQTNAPDFFLSYLELRVQSRLEPQIGLRHITYLQLALYPGMLAAFQKVSS